MTALLDTSMLIGLIKPEDEWHAWSVAQFAVLKIQGPLLLVDIVFAEWSVSMKDRNQLNTVISELGLDCALSCAQLVTGA